MGTSPGCAGTNFFMRVEVVIGRQNFGANQLFLQDGNELGQVDGFAVTDVVNFVRHGVARRAVNHAADTFDDVVNVSEIAQRVPEIAQLDIFAADKFVGELEVRHVGSSGRAVNREESQTGRGNAVKMAVAVSHELVEFFSWWRRG